MKKAETKQMVREIAGFTIDSGASFVEVLEAYCEGMSAKQIDAIEDLYYDMKAAGELDDIVGVQ